MIKNKAEHKKYEHHQLSEMFPIQPGSIDALAENIASVGLLKPLVLFEGKVLDGRKRQEACLKSSVEPKFTVFSGSSLQALDYVFAVNFPFSMLTPSQKACVAAEYMEIKLKNKPKIGNKSKDFIPQGKISHNIATQFNISVRILMEAQFLMRNAIEKFREVKAGKLQVHPVFMSFKPHRIEHKPIYLHSEKFNDAKALGVIESMSKDGWNFSYTRKGIHHYGCFWIERCGDLSIGHTSFADCVKLAVQCAHEKAEVAA